MPKTIKDSVVTEMYTRGLTIRDIAFKLHVSAPGVLKSLRRSGTPVRPKGRPRKPGTVEKPCKHCGATTLRRIYCSDTCYFAAIHNPKYFQWRHGQRLAREAVTAAGFALQPGHIVHHVDSDNRNNSLENLWVFANHADHMKYHRLGYVQLGYEPVWPAMQGTSGPKP